MKALNIKKNGKGFTLIEMMIVLAIVGILSSIAVPLLVSYRARVYDNVAKVDLRNAIKFLTFYFIENSTYPETSDGMLAAGFRLSEDVSFTTYKIGTFGDGQSTVHMHIKHSLSSNNWHANYPKEGGAIQIR